MWRFLWVFLLCWAGAAIAAAQRDVKILAKPSTGFVLDRAGILDSSAISKINRLAADAQRDVRAPIVVVTISSLSSVGAYSIESYAGQLFDEWAIGDKRTNRGVLVLVALEDRTARIEMGAGWSHQVDSRCDSIMQDWMIPSFKEGKYSQGILDGVSAINGLVRTGNLPSKPLPPWVIPVAICAGVFLLLFLFDLIKNRKDGWATGLFSSFTYPGHFGSGYYHISRSDNDDNSWGGWGGSSGGFSGGGSSGGGGSTGSW